MPRKTKATKAKIRTTRLYREATFQRDTLDMDERTVELAFSSENGVERWFGLEVLSHKKGAVRLDRLRDQGPLLLNHDSRDHIGTVVSAKIDSKNRTGRAVVRIGRGADRDAVLQDIEDGIRKSVSVGYAIHRMQLEEASDEGLDTYRATDWEPYEVSLVSMPADTSVGVGREAREWRQGDDGEHDTIILDLPAKEKIAMKFDNRGNPVAETDEDRAAIAAGTALCEDGTRFTPPAAAPATVVATAPVPVAPDADQIRKAELNRIRVIGKTGERYGQSDLAATAIDAGTSVADFNTQLLDAMPGAERQPAPANADIGLTNQERNDFSFVRLMRAQGLGSKMPQFIEDAAFELEACRAAEGSYEGRRLGGLVVPSDCLNHTREDLMRDSNVKAELVRQVMKNPRYQQRVMTEGVAGASSIAEDLLSGSFIDLLRNNMILTALGITTLPELEGDVAIPRQSGGGTAFWLATDQTDITESTPTLDQVTLTPKNVGAMEIYTRQLLLQSSVAIEQMIRGDIAMVLAIAMDLAGLYGTGAAGQPTGVANTAGIGAPGAFAAATPTHAEVVAFEDTVAVANALLGNLSYLTDPTIRGGLKTTEKFAGTGFTVWEPGNTLNGYRAEVSTQVTAGDVFFGNWSDLLHGLWSGMEVLADPYTLGARLNVRMIAVMTADFAVRHPASFALDNDT